MRRSLRSPHCLSAPLPWGITSVLPADPEIQCVPPPLFYNGSVLNLLGNGCLKTQWLDFTEIFFFFEDAQSCNSVKYSLNSIPSAGPMMWVIYITSLVIAVFASHLQRSPV